MRTYIGREREKTIFSEKRGHEFEFEREQGRIYEAGRKKKKKVVIILYSQKIKEIKYIHHSNRDRRFGF